jgi:tRNA(His) 5'-end guanylyltransferase
MSKDDFGDRMKSYEEIETARRFIPLLPVYARLDGRAFSTFTRGLARPYDQRITTIMQETTKYLVKETQAIIGYTQSDEINLLWIQDSPYTKMFFDGKIQKIVSVLAGMASAEFIISCLESEEDIRMRAIKYTPAFDCRVFQLPNQAEATNVILWREKDATKNAISMAARAYYSHTELQNKTSSEMQEMLFQKGVNFNDYPAFFKRGSFIRRVVTEKSLTEQEFLCIPEKNRPEVGQTFSRFNVERIDMPNFTKVKNREAVIFDRAQPETGDQL